MITSPPLPRQHAPAWQHALREAFTRPAELLNYLELDTKLPLPAATTLREFPLRVPRGFAARMRKGDPDDPLFRQIWPQIAEDQDHPGFVDDAVGDLHMTRGGGLIHKYHGRVLVMATGACGVNCRYCFRRHFPYGEHLAARDHWREALQTIRADASIGEVILSGGDPLSLSDDKLAELVDALEDIPHVRRLRLHTRQLVVLPERVDTHLLDWLGRSRLQKVVVLHANHAQELDASVARALQPLRQLGVQLLNQSVLLRGVNDRADALIELSERLSECGVLPYYVHLLDRVRGSAHFEVSDTQAQQLMRALVAALPGYLVPRLVREEPGAQSKTWIRW
ncbi:EF-P beta-lysylation protein EpmB [Sinimarinibacterium sp. CAU 1509]|uniref:EF-P beta-lysylation protein EpmB n=1 Tax=Sinimarinibacterium sp. CAU 1509 TaxID=2562283 RepID=UPI0010AB5E6D|nr:EF-P beta-lysylation protein EpmB [Sinimarinibacterium sp. CAU 1509]TJY61086.1 EF-P beta-lysylation protein EpmB [Sinimarinibacterium sp. CAU 1509]